MVKLIEFQNTMSNDKKQEPSVRELFEIVRKGMVFRGKALPEKFDRFASARLWIDEENITPGIHCVRSIAMHDNYMIWCKERGLSKESILASNKMGEFLASQFKPVIKHNVTYYYISKDLKENEEEKAKRKEKYDKTPKSKKPKTEET